MRATEPIVGLTWSQALQRLKSGYVVKRPHWDTYVYRDSQGLLRFRLPAKLIEGLGDDYRPSKDELTATDWEAVPAAQARKAA